MTLLEVVAAIMLVSTLLVMSLLALGRHARQIEVAQRKQEAVEFAQTWLETRRAASNEAWEMSPPLAGDAGDTMTWQLHSRDPVPSLSVGTLSMQVVRFEVHQKGASPETPPLTSVEMLMPRTPPTTEVQ